MSIVLMCTMFLVVQLRKISSWRKSVTSTKDQWGNKPGANHESSSPAAQSNISRKEERLVRMVVAIATIFIVSNTPSCLTLLCNILFDEFSLYSVYRRIFVISSTTAYLGQSISGGFNILIYYNMASKFRSRLRLLLRLDRQEQEK
ncbi:chemosensory receptor a [Plakobranchus ocellatus]|uniref:Chemosensory receptor a n=1 Tax=Plakobranchus ocellatus TaxID=259542 RepID=A0AAV4CAM1_9GAST|nr:chemosensory receptor a [Plakobranchus ocellatus]